jgi:DNA-binding NarL/FixJ family response regulator
MPAPIVLIADDHVIIRRGLIFLIESNFGKLKIEETDSVKGLLELIGQKPFTHLILDMQLVDANIMEVFPQLRKDYPSAQMLIYTMSPEEIFGKRLLNLGADGFLSKQSHEKEILKALSLFFNNQRYISSNLQKSALLASQTEQEKNPFLNLSDRETIVLNYLLKGEGVKEIAARLNVKVNTVATFKARLFDKLGVSNLMDMRNMASLYNFQYS